MDWILQHLQIVLPIAAAIAYLLKNRNQRSSDDTTRPDVGDVEKTERTRRVQEEIRRKIAERRGTAARGEGQPTIRERVPPLVRPVQVPPLDPFGGPMRRIVKRLEEAATSIDQRERDAAASVLERQQKLADEMRALEAARVAEKQRAAQIATMTSAMPAEMAGRQFQARDDVMTQLRDPRELRRAVVLREILGAPVGLR